MSEDSQAEVYKMSDGSHVNKFCMDQFNDLVANTESIWDILDIVTKLTRVKCIKDENGFVKDVELTIPRVDEVTTLYILKNLKKSYEDFKEVSPETRLEVRRLKLEQYFREEIDPRGSISGE